jgi:hypothetical protein
MTVITERLTAALADRYRIERELGAGGMATVYLAHDVKHDRSVVIKQQHDVTPDGQRFVMIRVLRGAVQRDLGYAEGWSAALAAKLR